MAQYTFTSWIFYLGEIKAYDHTDLYTNVLVHVCVQSCPTLCDPMNCSPPGSSDHGIP